jgi:hypothetical protein
VTASGAGQDRRPLDFDLHDHVAAVAHRASDVSEEHHLAAAVIIALPVGHGRDLFDTSHPRVVGDVTVRSRASADD